MAVSQTQTQTKWGVEVKKDQDLEIRYTRNGKPIYTVNVVGGVIYKFIDYTKYAGVSQTQSIINPWEKSTADVIITVDRGDWLNKICDAYAHFPGLSMHAEAAVGNVVVKLGNNIYCVRVSQKKRIELLNYMLWSIARSMHYDAFLLENEIMWYADKLEKYFNAINELNRIGIRSTKHLMAIENTLFA
jgi:hypothetical protein